MYGDEHQVVDLRLTERLMNCPAAEGVGTKLPRGAIDRWIMVRDACASWHNGAEPDEVVAEQFGVLDAVNRRICSDLFSSYVDLMADSRDRAEDLEGGHIVVPHPTADAATRAHVTFTLEGDDGPELVKLRTGRTGSSPWEKAVLLTAKDPGDTVVEVMTALGTVEHPDMDDGTREAALEGLFAAWDGQQSDDFGGGTRPGWWCYTCPRPARCGQYPTIDGRRISGYTRTIRLPKTWATRLRDCHRAVAWKQVHGIPEDDGTDYEDDRRQRGVRFHDLIATALTAEDPSDAFEIGLQAVPDSEVQNMRWLWERHLELEAAHEHPVTVRETEYEVGCTVEVKGRRIDSRTGSVADDQPVAIVFMGRADATGREADGTPAVIEVRTGAGAARVNQLEIDIYAIGVALLARKPTVAVHLHQLGLPDGPRCVREVYDEDRLGEAIERLEDPAVTVANWHPEDATQPGFTIGPWCSGCVFRRRCEGHR